MYRRKLEVLENIAKMLAEILAKLSGQLGQADKFNCSKPSGLEEKICQQKPPNVTLQDYKREFNCDTPDECQTLQAYVDLGVTYFMLYFADLPSVDGLRLFAEAVAKKI